MSIAASLPEIKIHINNNHAITKFSKIFNISISSYKLIFVKYKTQFLE